MAQETHSGRSPELLSRSDSALLVVDVQEKLLTAIPAREVIVWNIRRLLDAAALFQIPVAASEQYPRGLGPTAEVLAQRLESPAAKQRFSCHGCQIVPDTWTSAGIYKLVVTGIEAHVCVLQTVLDLLSAGFQIHVPVDAIGSRYRLDYDTALRRMEASGAVLTTTEMVMFEWCETAADPNFKQLSALVRETRPATTT